MACRGITDGNSWSVVRDLLPAYVDESRNSSHSQAIGLSGGVTSRPVGGLCEAASKAEIDSTKVSSIHDYLGARKSRLTSHSHLLIDLSICSLYCFLYLLIKVAGKCMGHNVLFADRRVFSCKNKLASTCTIIASVWRRQSSRFNTLATALVDHYTHSCRLLKGFQTKSKKV